MTFTTIKHVSLSGLLLIMGATGCFAENENYDRMKELAAKAQSSSADSPGALQQLIRGSQSSDYWQRFYALVYLEKIAVNKSQFRAQIIPILIDAIDDKDQATQREVVAAIRDIGAEAVDRAAPQLRELVNRGVERDVSWFAAEALGKSKDSDRRSEIVATLVRALDRIPPGNPEPASQIRYEALSSLVELGRTEPNGIVIELKRKLSTSDPIFAARIERAIDALGNTNQNH
jgi:HEAT repeat protein